MSQVQCRTVRSALARQSLRFDRRGSQICMTMPLQTMNGKYMSKGMGHPFRRDNGRKGPKVPADATTVSPTAA